MKERKKKLIKWGANEAVDVISMHAYFMPNQLFQIKTSNKCDKTTKKNQNYFLLPYRNSKLKSNNYLPRKYMETCITFS